MKKEILFANVFHFHFSISKWLLFLFLFCSWLLWIPKSNCNCRTRGRSAATLKRPKRLKRPRSRREARSVHSSTFWGRSRSRSRSRIWTKTHPDPAKKNLGKFILVSDHWELYWNLIGGNLLEFKLRTILLFNGNFMAFLLLNCNIKI